MDKTVYIIGPSGSGKTSLLTRWVDDYFPENVLPTCGLSFKTAQCELDECSFIAKIFDFSNVERNGNTSLTNADGCIIVVDLCDSNSKSLIHEYVEIARTQKPNLPIVIIGNKSDMTSERKCSRDDLKNESLKYHAPFFEASALTGDDVDISFGELMHMMVNHGHVAYDVPSNQADHNETDHKETKIPQTDESNDENTCCRI